MADETKKSEEFSPSEPEKKEKPTPPAPTVKVTQRSNRRVDGTHGDIVIVQTAEGSVYLLPFTLAKGKGKSFTVNPDQLIEE